MPASASSSLLFAFTTALTQARLPRMAAWVFSSRLLIAAWLVAADRDASAATGQFGDQPAGDGGLAGSGRALQGDRAGLVAVEEGSQRGSHGVRIAVRSGH